jgi:hypothetical protein
MAKRGSADRRELRLRQQLLEKVAALEAQATPAATFNSGHRWLRRTEF